MVADVDPHATDDRRASAGNSFPGHVRGGSCLHGVFCARRRPDGPLRTRLHRASHPLVPHTSHALVAHVPARVMLTAGPHFPLSQVRTAAASCVTDFSKLIPQEGGGVFEPLFREE